MATRLLCLFLLLLCGFYPAVARTASDPAVKQRLVAAIPPDLAPYYFRDTASGKPAGLAVELTDALARRMEVTVEYRFAKAWDESDQLLLSGEVDLIPLRVVNPDTSKKFLFSDVLDVAPISYIIRATDNRTKGPAAGLRVGVMKNSTAFTMLKDRRDITLQSYDSLQALLMDLVTGHLDMVLTFRTTIMQLAEQAGLADQIRALEPPVLESRRAIAVHPGNQALAARLNRVIPSFHNSPEYATIFQRWMGRPKPWWTVRRAVLAMGGVTAALLTVLLIWRYRGMQRLNRQLQEEIVGHQQATAALRANEERFRHLFHDHNAVFLLIEPVSGRIVDANASAERFYGYSVTEMQRMTVTDINALTPEQVTTERKKAFKQGTGHFEFPHRLKNGQIRTVEVYTALMDIQGETLLFSIVHDITERKRYEQELLQARQEADAANRAKSEFLANMSHEIRTPMNGIMGMLQLLRFTGLSAEQQEYLSSMELASKNLLSLISDILDLSKIEAGKIELEYADFSLRRTIHEVVTTQLSLIHQKKLQLNTSLPDELPELLHGDALRLKQILLNLVSNAIKFTEQGNITIATSVTNHHGGSVIVRLQVSDTGIGIAPEALVRIFAPFEQADNSTTRRYGGTGLGLAICRRLAELMGGRIWAESIAGEGSSFFVELPFMVPACSSVAATSSEEWSKPAVTRSPLKLLVAEDNPLNAETINAMLSKLGHQPELVVNGQQAVEKWRSGCYDGILMDVAMPVLGGDEATQIIREAEQQSGHRIPIIALTAHTLRGDRERFLSEGFDGYLSKPVEIRKLVEELNKAVMKG